MRELFADLLRERTDSGGDGAAGGDGQRLFVVPTPDDPMAVARAFVDELYTDPSGLLLLRHHRNDFHVWDGTCWPEAEAKSIRSRLYRWLEAAVYSKKGELVDEGDVLPATEVVAMANGLLHLPTRRLLPHSPRFYVHHALPFAFDPSASVPARWHRFLNDLWGDDTQAIDTLGEIFGYVVKNTTRLHKLFLIVGPKRSGKGTIARVLTGLLGAHNVAAPTLAALATNFGLQPLIGRPLAIVSDARLSSRADGTVAVERLLSISGEDFLTIDRKYRDPWTGRLSARFLILSNELPRLQDSSGALASRFIPLTLTRSFYGEEDPDLTDKLLEELAGILNWALEGLDRLEARGRFEVPTSAHEALRQLEDLSSPVGSFVRDHCAVAHGREVDKDDLYEAWRRWCERQGMGRSPSKPVFFRNLYAAFPGVGPARPRDGDERSNVVVGLEFRNSLTGPLTTPDQAGEHAAGQASWSGVEPPETPRSEGVVRGGQGSSAVFSHSDPAEAVRAVLVDGRPCVRCVKYGPDHTGEHLAEWPGVS